MIQTEPPAQTRAELRAPLSAGSAGDNHPDSNDATRRSQWPVGRWNEAMSSDFAACMDWCVRRFEEANHHPIVLIDGGASRQVMRREVVAGQTVSLDAAGTHDPDGDSLRYRWWHYVEASTYDRQVDLKNTDSRAAGLVVPAVERRQDIHIILEVTDDDRPPLVS